MSALAAALLATGLKLVASHSVYPEGAPPGFSGGFKEDSCHACHFHQDLNAPSGGVSVDGVPARYEPRTRYTLTITLSRADMKLAGFQLSARFKNDGAQAGTLAPAAVDNARVTIAKDGSVQYANQNKEGATLTRDGFAQWIIEWTAPDSGGPVSIDVAANAADGNGSADGDFVDTATVESAQIAPAARRLR